MLLALLLAAAPVDPVSTSHSAGEVFTASLAQAAPFVAVCGIPVLAFAVTFRGVTVDTPVWGTGLGIASMFFGAAILAGLTWAVGNVITWWLQPREVPQKAR